MRFKNRKNCKKNLSNKKKLSKIDCRKHNFSSNTKIFARENLILMNESIVDNCCKLKHNRLIYGCFSRDGIIRIKREERARPVKIFHMDKLHQLFPDFDFGDVDMTFFQMLLKWQMVPLNLAISVTSIIYIVGIFGHSINQNI